MTLPTGFEFVLNPDLPREPGMRQLNDFTYEVHPDAYEVFAHLFDGCELGSWDEVLDRVSRIDESQLHRWADLVAALYHLKQAMKQPPGDHPQPPEPTP